jgi:diaminohydroxyphosphoribosylaminopyrimidine deaminase / 5-amino-6-(5-phosphoribosylamino)uracil reductase
MKTDFSAFDHACMAEALRLAEQGLYTTDPNPRVGCVIAKGGEIVGRGFHRKAGEAHAEVNALHDAGEWARDATVYVTLEPCSHTGRTPPCVEALIEAGVALVIAAMQDPNPKVAGQGFERLRAAGIEIACGLMEAQSRALNQGFISRMTRKRPWVRSKVAVSLDGRTALANGVSKWISDSAAREDAHRWRARSSAILTGSGTVIADDPALTVRLEDDEIEWRQPLRVIVDSRLRTPATAKLLQEPGQVCIATLETDKQRQQRFIARGATVLVLSANGDHVDLGELLHSLVQRECNEVLVEAGPALNGALLQAGLIDELIIYMAPHLLGDTARAMFSIPAIAEMRMRRELRLTDLRQVGGNIRLALRLE